MQAIIRHSSIFFLIFFFGCITKNNNDTTSTKISNHKVLDTSFYSKIENQFNLIDSIRHTGDFEKADSIADGIVSILEKNKEIILELTDTLNYDLLYISKSFDNNFCLVSWDTRQGGTMIDFATMAIFKTPSGTKSKFLRDTTSEMGDTYMHYDTIYSIKSSNNRDIYLAQGFGQGSTALPWQEIRAFSIRADTIYNPKIFSDTCTNIFVEFDTHKFSDGANIPTIKVKNSGKFILVPKATEDEGFSKKYETLIYNGTSFISK